MMMRFVVDLAQDWDEYKNAWTTCMQNHYWFREPRLLDFSKEEELAEQEKDFGRDDRAFLVARREDSQDIVGVLGLKVAAHSGVIRRWEPSVVASEKNTRVGETLLQEGLKTLGRRGVTNVTSVLKFPKDLEQEVKWHADLFKRQGFEMPVPPAAQLIADLREYHVTQRSSPGVRIITGEKYDDQKLAEITIKAFTSTPEDKRIHGRYPSVTVPSEALKTIEDLRAGRMGPSPPEMWKVALVGNEAAGMTGSFIRIEPHQPKTGVLGPVGVLPEYRKRGIGAALVIAALQSMKKQGCEYALVSTPQENSAGIATYVRGGFSDLYRQMTFERTLSK